MLFTALSRRLLDDGPRSRWCPPAGRRRSPRPSAARSPLPRNPTAGGPGSDLPDQWIDRGTARSSPDRGEPAGRGEDERCGAGRSCRLVHRFESRRSRGAGGNHPLRPRWHGLGRLVSAGGRHALRPGEPARRTGRIRRRHRDCRICLSEPRWSRRNWRGYSPWRVLRRFSHASIGSCWGRGHPPSLLARYRASGLPVVRTYGMTRDHGWLCVRRAATGRTRLEIVDEEIVVSGPTVAAGYCGSASGGAAHFDGRRLYTGDRGEIVDGQLVVRGRLDDVVAVRGANVDRGRLSDCSRAPRRPGGGSGRRSRTRSTARGSSPTWWDRPIRPSCAPPWPMGSAPQPYRPLSLCRTCPDCLGQVDLPSLMAEASQRPEGR